MPGHDDAAAAGRSVGTPAPEPVHQRVYRIPAVNVEQFEARIRRLAAKAERLGCGPIRWEAVASEEVAVVRLPDQTTPAEVALADLTADVVPDEVRVYRHVTVIGDQPKLNGWRFLGTLQRSSDEDVGTILRTVPGETIPGEYRRRGLQCDHCRADRYRVDTYIVAHDDGRTAQVGSACLRDFVGHNSPAAVARYAEFLILAGGLAEEAEVAEPIGVAARQDPNGPYLPLRSYLATVRALIRQQGWVSRSTAREQGREGAATADIALALMLDPMLRPRLRALNVTPDDIEAVDAALDWIVELRERTDLTGYLWNLSVATAQTCLPRRSAAIAASLLAAHHRALAREGNARAADTRHFGTIGVRDVFDLTVVNVGCYDSDFGLLHIVRFVDDRGNAAIWKTHTSPEEIDLRIGRRYTVRATVKKHTTRQGDGQPLTVITRSRIEARHGPADRLADPTTPRGGPSLANHMEQAAALSPGPEDPVGAEAEREAQLALGL
jgi:hypothetical protein